jgi:hypothetical protein
LEVVVESMVGERLQARRVVSHDIFRSWEIGGSMAVAVLALMVTGDLA